MSRRLLGNFSPENLIRVLNFVPRTQPSLILLRNGPRRPDLSKGPPGQHNFVTVSAMAKKVGSSAFTTMEASKQNSEGKVNVIQPSVD